MDKKCEIRLVGSGGQGVILCAILLAKAAIGNGVNVAQSQSYGPEARGGACRAEVVVSDEPIDYPKVEKSDFLMALTQASLEKYLPKAKPGSIVLYDDSLTFPENAQGFEAHALPILETARVKVGKAMTANIVALGVINACLKITDPDTLRETVLAGVPRGTEKINLAALEEGSRLSESI